MKLIITDTSRLPQAFVKNLSAIAITLEKLISFTKDKYRRRYDGFTYFRRDQLINSHPVLTRYFIDQIGIPLLKRLGFLRTIQPFRYKKDATQFFKLDYRLFQKFGLQVWGDQNNFLSIGDSENLKQNTIELEELTSKNHNVLKKQCKQNANKKPKKRSQSLHQQENQDNFRPKEENIVSQFGKKDNFPPAPQKCSSTQEKSIGGIKTRSDQVCPGNGKITQADRRISSGASSSRNNRNDSRRNKKDSGSLRLRTHERRFNRNKLRSLILEKLNYSVNDIEVSCLMRFEFANIIDAIAIVAKQVKKKTIKSIPAYLTGILKKWRDLAIEISPVVRTESMKEYFKRMEQKDEELALLRKETTRIDIKKLRSLCKST